MSNYIPQVHDIIRENSWGTVKVAGLKEFANALRELPGRVAQKKLASPVAEAGAMIRDCARNMAPVFHGDPRKGAPPPGTLRKSIVLKRVGSDNPATTLTARYIVAVRHGKSYQDRGKKHLNLDAYYWTFVEFGSLHNRRQSFLRPAFESLKNDALRLIMRGIALGIEEEAKPLSWGTPR
jgi:HK97 gp10 family phage protein